MRPDASGCVRPGDPQSGNQHLAQVAHRVFGGGALLTELIDQRVSECGKRASDAFEPLECLDPASVRQGVEPGPAQHLDTSLDLRQRSIDGGTFGT